MMQAGRRLLLAHLLKGTTLRLYTNDRTPKDGDAADMYREPEAAGYRPVGLHETEWKLSGDRAECKAVFTFTGRGDEIQGWFLTRGDVLIDAKQLDEPFPVRIRGDELAVKAWVELSRKGAPT